MKRQPIGERASEWWRTHIKIPLGVRVALCVLPAAVVALFYILRSKRDVMDWISVYVALPVRRFLGMLSSIYPPALMELLCTIAGLFLIYYIIKAFLDSSRRRKKWSLLGRRFMWLLVTACYFYGAFCWLWSSGYHAAGFAEKSNIKADGVQTEDLISVAGFFAQNANELSTTLERDERGNLIINRREMFTQSRSIYSNISGQFPVLSGTVYAPKPMYLYSWLMTITGYSGMYFALTGEAMVNSRIHPAFMPAVVAHEHAHQLGVFAEGEANFAGILACTTSGNPVFEYSGYLSGLNYLLGALSYADYNAYEEIISGLAYEVRLDRFQNYKFWSEAKTSDFGIEWLDSFLSSLMESSSTIVDSAYDGYLKSQSQELGLQSYGTCVDLLVGYFTEAARMPR